MSRFSSESLRTASPADVDVVRTLVRAAYAKWVPVIGREPLPMVADNERAVREHEIELLEADGELIGLIELIRNRDHLFIENVAVAPAHQGRGAGRRLLAHAERIARASGLPEIRLMANSAFESNIRLYEWLGYRIERRERFWGRRRGPHEQEIRAGMTARTGVNPPASNVLL